MVLVQVRLASNTVDEIGNILNMFLHAPDMKLKLASADIKKVIEYFENNIHVSNYEKYASLLSLDDPEKEKFERFIHGKMKGHREQFEIESGPLCTVGSTASPRRRYEVNIVESSDCGCSVSRRRQPISSPAASPRTLPLRMPSPVRRVATPAAPRMPSPRTDAPSPPRRDIPSPRKDIPSPRRRPSSRRETPRTPPVSKASPRNIEERIEIPIIAAVEVAEMVDDMVKDKKKNPFFTWSAEYKPIVKRDYPDLNGNQIRTKLGEIWKALPENEKKKYK